MVAQGSAWLHRAAHDCTGLRMIAQCYEELHRAFPVRSNELGVMEAITDGLLVWDVAAKRTLVVIWSSGSGVFLISDGVDITYC